MYGLHIYVYTVSPYIRISTVFMYPDVTAARAMVPYTLNLKP